MNIAITAWVSVVFKGILLGSALLFFRHFFSPVLTSKYGDSIALDIPDWLYILTGIAAVVLWSSLRGKPLLKDTNREQLESIEYVLRNLPELERRQIYRSLAKKIVAQFSLDNDFKFDLKEEADKSIQAEK